MMLKRAGVLLATAVALAGCAEESPVGLDDLLPPGTVHTVELVLDAPQFLLADTTITGFIQPASLGYLVVARDFDGALNANSLVRFSLPPRSVAYTDSGGTARVDTLPRLIGGEVVVQVDTARTRLAAPVSLALHTLAEPWDGQTAGWAFRVDSGPANRQPWTQPGGTTGTRVATATLAPGATSATFAVDSLTMAQWADTTNAARGALIAAETPGVRLRIEAVRLRFRARPSANPGIMVTDSVGARAATFVFDPPAEATGRLLAGGAPAWRSFLRFRERLDTLSVPGLCAAPVTCRLSDATVSYAALLVQPVAAPPGFAPADTVVLDVRPVFGDSKVPLSRSPLGAPVALTTRIAPGLFANPQAPRVEIGITGVVTALAMKPQEGQDPQRAILALVGATEGNQFGVASFGASGAGAAAPKLRLILSVTSEAQLR